MNRLLLLIALPFLLFLPLLSQYANLTTNAPHSGGWGTGTVEEAIFYLSPQGSYCRNDAVLSFSARGASYSPGDSLEVVLGFSLPSGSFVTDLWLWIEGVPVQAMIVDRAKARATYENIVKRIRRDPAILERQYNDYYSLKIYPLLAQGIRKIKLSYCSPYNSALNNSLASSLPVWIINASANTVDTMRVIVLKNNWRGKPQFVQDLNVQFTGQGDTAYAAAVPGTAVKQINNLEVGFIDDFGSNPLFTERFGTENSGSYILRVSPYRNFSLPTNRKMLFLVDHDSLKSEYGKQELYQQIIDAIGTKLTPADSFNVVLTGKKQCYFASDGWMAGDVDAMKSAFSKILRPDLLDTVNLGALLFAGIDFIYSHGKENSTIIVFSSSDEYNSVAKANTYYDSLAKRFSFDVPVYFLDYGYYYSWLYTGGLYYNGNGYLYWLISRNSKGNYWPDYYNFPANLNTALNELRGYIEYFDLITYLQNGFTYEKVNSSYLTKLPVFSYFTQYGKYSGTFPLIVQMTGKYRDSTYHQTFSIPESLVVQDDSSLNIYGAYQQIVLLRQDNSQLARDRIVELSIQHRILSEYTAFLALEPGQKLCDSCQETMNGNGPAVTFVYEEPAMPTTYEIMWAYPNPFNPSTTLRIRLPQGMKSNGVNLAIYNVLGQLVKSFTQLELSDAHSTDIVWNGRTDEGRMVSSGVYFAVLTTPQKRHTVKLMMMK